jgi:hypothetical protein
MFFPSLPPGLFLSLGTNLWQTRTQAGSPNFPASDRGTHASGAAPVSAVRNEFSLALCRLPGRGSTSEYDHAGTGSRGLAFPDTSALERRAGPFPQRRLRRSNPEISTGTAGESNVRRGICRSDARVSQGEGCSAGPAVGRSSSGTCGDGRGLFPSGQKLVRRSKSGSRSSIPATPTLAPTWDSLEYAGPSRYTRADGP